MPEPHLWGPRVGRGTNLPGSVHVLSFLKVSKAHSTRKLRVLDRTTASSKSQTGSREFTGGILPFHHTSLHCRGVAMVMGSGG